MPEIQSSRISKLYRSTLLRSYSLGFIGFIVGIKICDLLMYDPKKHEIEMELMEQQFWKINGQPKYLRGETVESVVRPGTMRTSWIQVVYGKDKYISREQAQE